MKMPSVQWLVTFGFAIGFAIRGDDKLWLFIAASLIISAIDRAADSERDVE